MVLLLRLLLRLLRLHVRFSAMLFMHLAGCLAQASAVDVHWTALAAVGGGWRGGGLGTLSRWVACACVYTHVCACACASRGVSLRVGGGLIVSWAAVV